jgi:hypothetical protein
VVKIELVNTSESSATVGGALSTAARPTRVQRVREMGDFMISFL